MSRAWLVQPGVPAMGHVTSRGWWHPGNTDGCQRCVLPEAFRAPDVHGNIVAREGVDRCTCGCKYWEKDRCIDCGSAPPR